MAPRHDVNGPCSCGKCGGQLQVKLAKGGNFPGHHYIHCVPCGYHFVFPKADIPRSVTVSPQPFLSPPPATQGSLTQPRTIDCSKPGCMRRGCIQCLRRMCKQCCIAQSGCSLRAHTFEQLSARQRSKLPELPMALQADEFPLDPSLRAISLDASYKTPHPPSLLPSSSVPSHLDDEEKRQYEAAIAASLQPTTTALLSPSTVDEDQQQYAAAIAASLRLPGAPSSSSVYVSMSSYPPPLRGSISAASAGPSRPAVPATSHPSTTPSTKEHLSEDWMRPAEDKTKKPKRVRVNLDNRFSLVFWHQDGKAPKVRAIHECPVWPKWIFMDAIDIREEFDIRATLLEYYDVRSCQWITCSLSYPHDVKRDGYLLLRLLETSCLGLDNYVQQAVAKDTHLRNNMAGERAGVRQKLQKRKIDPPPFLVNLSDDDDEVMIVEPPRPKRHAEDDVDINGRPSQRQCSHLAGPSIPLSPSPPPPSLYCDTSISFSPFSRSSSITTMSPRPPSPTPAPDDIYVPEGFKWPEGMYAIDMARGFHRIDQGGDGVLKDRLFTIFGRQIPITTYRDQRRNWKALTQRRRDELKAFGRVPAGLWSLVPKTKK
ncbi:hypothetical protein BDZ97DRAFT_1778362 [Flammula alnicola]|nr:hypothetical protein BDZ97DRAFT_1778362 [Flammula alnicola]